MRSSYGSFIFLFPFVRCLPVYRHGDPSVRQRPRELYNEEGLLPLADVSPQQVLSPDSSSATPILFIPENTPLPSQPSTMDGSGSQSPKPIVAAYFPDWTANKFPPEAVDFDRLDWVDFAFAVPDANTFTPKLDLGSGKLLSRLISTAHAKGKHVKLSIGGWTGSGHFSDAVSDENRDDFANNIVEMYHQYNLDGIDIDWEYPGEAGAAGNTFSASDSENLLTFLRLLRSLLPDGAHITAATQVWPFQGADGTRMKNVSSFAQVLDWVLLMNYDVWNSSPHPGPNAPLSDACHNSSQPEANAHAAVAAWMAAGFPAHQIMLGVPAYGYVSKSTATRLRSRRRALDGLAVAGSVNLEESTTPSDSDSDSDGGNVTVFSEDGSPEKGQVQFSALISQGALAKDGTGSFVGAGGFQRGWDACSNTPFLRSSTGEQVVTYDDPESLSMKAAFVREKGLRGVNMWDAHGDTPQWDLIDALRRGLGV